MPIRTKLFRETETKLDVPDLAVYIKKLSADHTCAEIAAIIGLTRSTVYVWLVKMELNRSPSEAMQLAWEQGKWDRAASRQRAYDSGFHKAHQGRQCPWKGERLPDDWRENISLGMTGTRTGSDHPLWRGGKTSRRGSGWNRAKRQAIQDAHNRCQICHRHESELDRPLEVHHKIPLRYFEHPSDAHFQRNLIVLCRQCHQRQELKVNHDLPLFATSEVAHADEPPKPANLRACEICGKQYKPARSRQRYCSHECLYAASTRRLRELPPVQGMTTICPICGIAFKVRPYRLQHHEVVTCSRQCRAKAVETGLVKCRKG